MPELPEVETVARTLAPSVEGKYITGVQVLWDKTLQGEIQAVQPGPQCILGRQVSKVSRRAKVLLLHLAPSPDACGCEPHLIAFHLKMSGQVMVHPLEEPLHKHTRLVFDLADTAGGPAVRRLFFDDTRKFGYCRILTPKTLENWPFWVGLGPEPLEIAAPAFARCFLDAKGKPRSGKIKALLLDQSVLAGIGNIYADEALFRAGISPVAKAADLKPANFTHLHQAVQEVLLESINACGSSIRDYRDADGNVGAFQNNFRVYGRKGQNCVTCGTPLEDTRVAGRATVYCPHCQSGRG